MTEIQHIELGRGDDVDFVIEFVTDDFEETPVPLTEISDVRFTIRTDWATDELDNSTAVYAASFASGISAFGDASVLLEMPKSVTVALSQAPKPFVYDVEILTSTGKTKTTQKGYVQIALDVGRS